MIDADVDLKKLERDLVGIAAVFGEANETGIARWGVAVARRLVTSTQAWGATKEAKIKQWNAMIADGKRAFIVVKNPKLVKRLMEKKLGGLHTSRGFFRFREHQQMTDAQNVNDFIDYNRTSRNARVPALDSGMVCVTSEKIFKQAMRERYKRAGKAKGGWIGAGQEIGKFQKTGSRITIGKNIANYAHKFKDGGNARMKHDIWNPEGQITNSYGHVSSEHVLKKSEMEKALAFAARQTIKEYEKKLERKLRNRK